MDIEGEVGFDFENWTDWSQHHKYYPVLKSHSIRYRFHQDTPVNNNCVILILLIIDSPNTVDLNLIDAPDIFWLTNDTAQNLLSMQVMERCALREEAGVLDGFELPEVT